MNRHPENTERTPEALASIEAGIVNVLYEGWTCGDPAVRSVLAGSDNVSELWQALLDGLSDEEREVRRRRAVLELTGGNFGLWLTSVPPRAGDIEDQTDHLMAGIVLSWKLGVSREDALEMLLRAEHLGPQLLIGAAPLEEVAQIREMLSPLSVQTRVTEGQEGR
jgi:hypothetical protein